MKKRLVLIILFLLILAASVIYYQKEYKPAHTVSYTTAFLKVAAKHGQEQTIETLNQNDELFVIHVNDKKSWAKLKTGKQYTMELETKNNISTFKGFTPKQN